jgi:hypothetical protein
VYCYAATRTRSEKKGIKNKYVPYDTESNKPYYLLQSNQINPGQGMDVDEYHYGFRTVAPPLRRLLPRLISPRSLSISVSLHPIKLAPLLPSPPTAWT